MTSQRQHLPETLPSFASSFALFPTFVGQQLRQMRAPPLLRQKQGGSEGNTKHKIPFLLSRRTVDTNRRGFCANPISDEQRIASQPLQRGLLSVAHHDADEFIWQLETHRGTSQLLNTSTSSQRTTGRELRCVPQPRGCMIAHTWPSLILLEEY